VFLIGYAVLPYLPTILTSSPPGPFRRWLALYYCELTQREVEYISLSRDTSEADIKQRREIRGKDVVYVDQCAVTAAIKGRVLILEGLEKCERNVLPILNNLLENRYVFVLFFVLFCFVLFFFFQTLRSILSHS
jgi:hypothetical protein